MMTTKITTLASYGTSTGLMTAGVWGVDEWVALAGGIAVLGTFLTNLYFQIRKDRRERDK